MKNIPILFENDDLLVLDKPSGLSVQGGKGIGLSLDSLLAEAWTPRPLLVHRLDRDTSGVIVTAKNKKSAAACSAVFNGAGNRSGERPLRSGLDKRYLALCAGVIKKGGVIRETLVIRGREYPAETAYMTLDSAVLPECSCTLVELKPVTGRMHQIRRHLAGMGCPVLGDDKYGHFDLNRKLKKALGLNRLLLHAFSIRLPPPLVTEEVEISAPLPEYFAAFLEQAGLRKRPV